jgi:hypothetical protein
VRFPQAQRCGSASWWGIFLCTLLLASTYVVFDVLDVDGSQMSRGPAPDMMVAATPEVAEERLVRATVAVAGSTDLLPPLSLPCLSAGGPRRISAATTFLHLPRGHVFPRVTRAAARARGSWPTADPL